MSAHPQQRIFEGGIASCLRTIAGAPAANRPKVFSLMAREAIRFARRGEIELQDIVDRLHDTAVSTGLVEAVGEDEVQSTLAAAMVDEPVSIDTPRHAATDKAVVLPFIDVASLKGIEPPEMRWLVANRIPAGNVTLLSGDGAAGKTTIAMQLAVGVAAIGSWLNAVVDHAGPVLFLSAEEDGDELHRRVLRIARHHGIGLEKLAGLHMLGMPGEDALLGIADRSGVIRPTPLFNALEGRAREIRPALIVIEAAADTFGGNENDRSQVRQFVGLLRRLCIAADGAALVLIAHPSLTGMASGTGTSGSTGWSNSVRSRLYFARARRSDDDETADDDVRELRVMKSNYGPCGETVRTRWQNGVFVPEGTASTHARASAEADAERIYLTCLDASMVQGRDVFSSTGHGYAPNVFAKMPQAKGLPRRALIAAQERLFAADRIHVVSHGPASRPTRRIERKEGAE